MALESCAASDRKANESLILRLKTHARNLCLFWQAKWFEAARDACRAGGERVFADCDVRQICVELNGASIRCAIGACLVVRTTTTAIQDK